MKQRYYLHAARIVFQGVLISICNLSFWAYFGVYVSIVPALLIIKNRSAFLQLKQPRLLTLILVIFAYQKLHIFGFCLRIYFDLKNFECNQEFGSFLQKIGATRRPSLLLNTCDIFRYHIYRCLLVSFIYTGLIRPMQSFLIL